MTCTEIAVMVVDAVESEYHEETGGCWSTGQYQQHFNSAVATCEAAR
jgi:hypothetical protein